MKSEIFIAIIEKQKADERYERDTAEKRRHAGWLDMVRAHDQAVAIGRNWRLHREQRVKLLSKQGLSAQQIADKWNDELRSDPAWKEARAFVDVDGKNNVDDLIEEALLTRANVLRILKK